MTVTTPNDPWNDSQQTHNESTTLFSSASPSSVPWTIAQQQQQQQSLSLPPRMPPQTWLHDANDETSFPAPTRRKDSTTVTTDARLQYLQELLVHPVLLAMKEQEEAERIAIVWNPPPHTTSSSSSSSLLSGLVHQLSLHDTVEHVYIMKESLQDCVHHDSQYVQVHHEPLDLTVECVGMDQLPPAFQVDVVLMLDDCRHMLWNDERPLPDDQGQREEEEEQDETFRFWFDHLSSESGSLLTCVGPTLPLHHPQSSQKYQDRIDIMEDLVDADFVKIIEYDLRLPQSRYAQSVAVAFKDETSVAQWRLNQAHYDLLLQQRVEDSHELEWFDSATMLTFKYPSKQSAVHFCSNHVRLDDADAEADRQDICADQHGYDPFTDNVPIDQLYVSKSQAGDHAGRGVFAKIDIPVDTYVGLETTVQSVLYEWKTTDVHNDMMDHVPAYANSKGHIIYVFAEAYGYSQEPWNVPQEAVMSHMLTFLNHGCNGTSNIGDFSMMDLTEFSIDLESGEIPPLLSTKVDVPYMPAFDRDQAKRETMCRSSRPIKAGEELYDNYMSFGGDQYFKDMVEMLRQECSGTSGMVEQYQKSATVHIPGGAHAADNGTWARYQGHQEL